MKIRIITGVLCSALLILLVLFANWYVIAATAFIASVIGLYELYGVTGTIKDIPFAVSGFLGAALITAANLFFPEKAFMFISLWIILVFIIALKSGANPETTKAAFVVFSVFYIPNFFSYIPLIFKSDDGKLLIWFVLCGAFITDTLAYFTGTFFGKHKLCPAISPKKTVEGAIGGTLGTGICFFVLAIIFNRFFKTDYNILLLFFFGIITAVISQLGDLCASLIKRNSGVKDYGTVFPGHGGIMDRCDSLLFVAPIIYFLFNTL